jgi:predicted nucleic acid-binding protein
MCLVSAVVVDTSVWIQFFRGDSLPGLESALSDGLVLLCPIVAAELLSAPLTKRERASLTDFLADLPIAATPREHWFAVGALRAEAAKLGLTLSTPDAHVAQCARDVGGAVWSRDAIFQKLAQKRLVTMASSSA